MTTSVLLSIGWGKYFGIGAAAPRAMPKHATRVQEIARTIDLELKVAKVPCQPDMLKFVENLGQLGLVKTC